MSARRIPSATVVLVRNAASYDFGGAERLVVHLAEELERNSLHAVVISRHSQVLAYAQQRQMTYRKGWWWSNQNWSGRHALLFPLYLGWQIFLTCWYVQILLQTHAEAINLMSKDDFIAGTVAGRLLGKRVVWTDCADLKHIYANHNVWYKNPVGKVIYFVSKFAHHVILMSQSEQRLVASSLHHSLPANYTVIHLAGRDEKVTPIAREGKDRSAVIFCATSRLVVAKGILELIDAFQRLSKTNDNFRLWLVGDGPDRDLCRERAKGNPNIIFWGHQDKPLPYLAASDIYVHPTHHEAFSLSLAEAAMLGKPMIASDIGGNPELVNQGNGLLFPVKNIDALEAAMRELGADQARRKTLGTQARHDYTTNFDFAIIVKEKLVPLYATQ